MLPRLTHSVALSRALQAEGGERAWCGKSPEPGERPTRLRPRARQADDFGDKGLSVQLEDMVRDESGHSEETERILRDWPL